MGAIHAPSEDSPASLIAHVSKDLTKQVATGPSTPCWRGCLVPAGRRVQASRLALLLLEESRLASASGLM
jgi:hypothetical protein